MCSLQSLVAPLSGKPLPPLTGPFDLAIQVPSAAVNRVLASLHVQDRMALGQPHSIGPFLIDDSGASAHDRPEERSGVRAVVRAQLSPADVSVDAETGITVTTHIRAEAISVGGRINPPLGVAGRLIVRAPLSQRSSAHGELIMLDLAAEAVTLDFTPDPGARVAPAEQRLVARVAGEILRTAQAPGVLFRRAELGDGRRLGPVRAGIRGRGVLQLGLTLDGRSEPAERLVEVPGFLEPADDAALVVSGGLLERELQARLAGQNVFWIRAGPLSWEVTLQPPTLRLDRGVVRFHLDGFADAHAPLGLGNASFHVDQDFGLDMIGLTPRLFAVRDPSVTVDGLAGVLAGPFRSQIIAEIRRVRDDYLSRANRDFAASIPISLINTALADIGLSASSVTVRTTSVTPDGVVIRIVTSPRPAPPRPIASFVQRPLPGDLLELDAFGSWVPGGYIEEFRWVGVASDTLELRAGSRFSTLAAARDVSGTDYRWCLQISGRRSPVLGGAFVESTACRVPNRFMVPHPRQLAAWEWTPVVIWDPGDPAPHVRVVGHINPAAGVTTTTPVVALLTNWTLDSARDIRSLSAPDAFSYQTVIVLPEGRPFEVTHEEYKEYLAGVPIGEDVGGAWSKRLGLESEGIAILNAEGDVVWKEAGLTLEGLQAAIEQHVPKESSRTGMALEGSAIAPPGSSVPSFMVHLDNGVRAASGVLVGEPFHLLFVALWSAPSMQALEDLKSRKVEVGESTVVVVVGDASAGGCSELLDAAPPGTLLVIDTAQMLASQLAVRCLPTTIHVDAEGRIASVTEGLHWRKKDAGSSGMTEVTTA